MRSRASGRPYNPDTEIELLWQEVDHSKQMSAVVVDQITDRLNGLGNAAQSLDERMGRAFTRLTEQERLTGELKSRQTEQERVNSERQTKLEARHDQMEKSGKPSKAPRSQNREALQWIGGGLLLAAAFGSSVAGKMPWDLFKELALAALKARGAG